jgi:hypothetical protein
LAVLKSAKKLNHLNKPLALGREAIMSDRLGDVTSNVSEQANAMTVNLMQL